VGTGPLGLRLLADQKQMVVANYYENSISMVNLADNKTETIPLAIKGKRYLNPTHVALDATKRIAYVVSSGTVGNLLTFDLATNQFISAASIGGLPFDVLTVPN
jgi:DNA-binding beta-propeller fold protein YncE